jgi:ABC-type transport system involved in multi-copper enzyme maturation permease subunit
MQAFLAILRYDLGQLARSWLLRIWVLLLVGPAFFLIVVASTEGELASETLGAYLGAVLAPLSGVAVAVLAAAAVSGESGIVSDSILSRSVTRSEYLWAKIVSRLGVTLAVYLVVVVPFAYFVTRYAVSDVTIGGVTVGVLMVGALLGFLAAFGLALSTVMRNVLMAVLVVLLLLVASGVALQFLGLSWMSTTAVLNDLPDTFRGTTPVWDSVRVLLIFPMLSMLALASALWIFRQKDL